MPVETGAQNSTRMANLLLVEDEPVMASRMRELLGPP